MGVSHLRRWFGSERGSVLAAGLLLSLALVMVIGAAVDIAQAFIVRRELAAMADDAALRGSQELDLEVLHAGGLALEPGRARAAALSAAGGQDMTVEASASAATVSVTVRRRVPTIILGVVGVGSLDVAAHATAEPRGP